MAGDFGRRPCYSPRSGGHEVSKAARSHRRQLTKDVREMALIGEPHDTGNLADREIRGGEQPLRPLDARPQDVFMRRDSHGFAELPMEVEATDSCNARQIIEADRAADPRIDIRHDASQLVARSPAAAGARRLWGRGPPPPGGGNPPGARGTSSLGQWHPPPAIPASSHSRRN